MKKYILTTVAILIIFSGSAQIYENICTAGETLFSHGQELKGFRYDSILQFGNTDTLFFSFAAARDTSGSCLDTTGGSVLGRQVIRYADGWFAFFNYQHDTIFVNTQAVVDDTWKFLSLPEMAYLEARVTGMSIDSFAGVTDSVKVITLQAKDSTGQNISHIFNSKEIRLSKHYGFTKVYDLYQVPRDTIAYLLTGKSQPMVGLQEATVKDIYDFNIGDEFHFTGHEETLMSYTYVYNWKEIWTILDKITTGSTDTVKYVIHKCRKTARYDNSWPQEVTYITTDSTVMQSYFFPQLAILPEFTKFPDEYLMGENNNYQASKDYWHTSQYNQRMLKGHYITGGTGTNQCYQYVVIGYRYNEYTKGLGMTKGFQYCNLYGSYNYDHHLVYYKKGQETWGTPVATDCNQLFQCASLDPDTLILASTPASRDTLFINTAYSWNITGQIPSWLSVNNTSGTGNGQVVYSSEKVNKDTVSRLAVFSLHCVGGDSYIFRVIQQRTPLYANPDTILLAHAMMSEDTLLINTSNSNFSWQIHGEIPAWLSLVPATGMGNGKVVFRAEQANQDTIMRSSGFTLSSPELSEDIPITVIQEGRSTGMTETGELSIGLFPNPTTGIVRFRSVERIECVIVFDPMGIMLRSIPFNENQGILDLSGNGNGLFILRFVTEKREANLKIVVL
jgi:hypothetical protein